MYFRIFVSAIVIFSFAALKMMHLFTLSTKIDPYKIYKEGLDAFETNDFFSLVKNFQKLNKTLK